MKNIYPPHLASVARPFRRRLPALLASALLALPAAGSASVPDVTQLSLEQLLQVTVIGASKYAQRQEEVAAAISVITRDEIKAFGWRTIDEALMSLPGIHITYDRQYSYLGTRGFGVPGDFNTRLLLTINGNRVNDVVYDAALSGRSFPVDLDLVERIEYIPGPGGAVYGQNALFGVVNVVTRDGGAINAVELAAAYQDLHTSRKGRATWGGTLGNGVDIVLSAAAMNARGEDYFLEFPGSSATYAWLSSESGFARGMDSERDHEFFASVARGPWSFNFSYGDNRKDDPTASYFSEPLVPGQYQRDRHLLTQLQYQDSLAGDTLQFTARLFLGRERYTALFYYPDSGGGSFSNPYLATGSSDWQGLELRLLSTAWADHKLLLGMEVQDNSRREQTNVNQNDPADRVDIPGSGWRAGIYAQDEWAVSDTLTATLGVRLDRNDITGNKLSPRAALIWEANDATTVKALYGRAHRAPNAFERDFDDAGISQLANPGLKGETVDTLELVLDRRLDKDLRLRGSLYHWRMTGLVTLAEISSGGATLGQYQNGEDVRAIGAEFSADKTWAWGGRLRGSLSYQDVQYDNGGELPNSPRLLAKLNVSGPLWGTGARFGYELQYSSERLSLAGTDVDGYWLSNLHFSTDRLMKGLELSLGLYNLFDQRYEQPVAYGLYTWQNTLEQDRRAARLKATYRF
ncbi:MAG: TonB-dependent receptor plug domain-containing protein [Thiobacillus sp.]